jgi:arsenate reductase (thioredoxin)
MKFSFGSKSKTGQKKTILFVCVENAGRSQMAEGFFRKYAPEGYEPMSAGTKPVSQINPVVVQAMGEVGVDIKQQKPKDITKDMMIVISRFASSFFVFFYIQCLRLLYILDLLSL